MGGGALSIDVGGLGMKGNGDMNFGGFSTGGFGSEGIEGRLATESSHCKADR